MRHQHQPPPTVAILGADTLAEDILAKLLRDEGYDTRLLEAHPTGLIDQWLNGADVLLLTPGLNDAVRRSFPETMRSLPEAASIPLIPLSATLEEALLDELAVEDSWWQQFQRLLGQIEAALGGEDASGSGEPPPAEAEAV